MAIPELPPLIGQSRAFLDLIDRVSEAAPLDRPVLVIGERGTGKELVAARLHYLSRRWDQDYVKVNCAALAENLLESELFGHEAGAFTGAVRRRRGRFEQADGGSLFLDEIAQASLAVQEKILRVSEYGELERLGAEQSLQVDVRLICATNQDLPAAADAGRFRHDLLDRLSFDVLTLPPLRARADDVPLLADHFGRGMARELGWEGYPGFSSAALDRLVAYGWPGNVRELKNLVERAVYRAEDRDQPIDDLVFDPFASPFRPVEAVRSNGDQAATSAGDSGGSVADGEAGVPDASRALDYQETLATIERRLLAQALETCRHNQRATAAHLNLSYDQLRYQLKKHGLLEAG